LTAARTLKSQKAGVLPGHPRLHFEEFPYLGLAQTYNTDKMGPDSAGTATAYLCGVKTNLGVLGLDERVTMGNCKSHTGTPDTVVKCVAEYMGEAGKSVGLVSTKSITDASPAPVYAHSADRDWESDRELTTEAITNGCPDIASQLIDSATYVNVALGGGSNFFSSSYRRDKRDLPAEWLAKKTQAGRKPAYVTTGAALRAVNTATTTDLFGLFATGSMYYDLERETLGSSQPTIAEMAVKALEILQQNPKGYFLFVEGGKIDNAHHGNQASYSLHDTLAFEKAIIEVMKKVNTDDTLVLVSADHSHVFTYGTYTSRTNFILDPTDSSSDSNGKRFTNLVYANGPGYAISSTGTRPTLTAAMTNANTYKFEAAVPLSSETHGCEEVAIYATGPQGHLVSSIVEQSTVAHLMLYSACLGPHANSAHCTTRSDDDSARSEGARFKIRG
jgi:alkaline phosphatase